MGDFKFMAKQTGANTYVLPAAEAMRVPVTAFLSEELYAA